MRFKELTLRRYGHFTDFSLHFPGGQDSASNDSSKVKTPDFHILYGPNEAGKSTTLAAITDLLYGFERVTPWKFLHSNELLEIESVLQQNEQSASIKRFKNHLSDFNNNRIDSFPLDLQGLSRDDYQRRFSFDEKTLQDGGEQILNSQGDVGQALFSASSGISDFSKRLEQVMEPANQFWSPGKKKIRLAELKKSLTDNKAQLNNLRLDIKVWQSRHDALGKTLQRLNATKESRQGLKESIQQLEKRNALFTLTKTWASRKANRDALYAEGIADLSSTSALDLTTTDAIQLELKNIRHLIQNEQLVASRIIESNTQIAELQAQLMKSSLSDSDTLALKLKDHITYVSEGASAARELQRQLGDAQNTMEHTDTLLSDYAITLKCNRPELDSLPGESKLASIERLLSAELSLTDRLAIAKDELVDIQQREPVAITQSETKDKSSVVGILSDVLTRLLKSNPVEKRHSARQNEQSAQQQLNALCLDMGIPIDALGGLQLPDERLLNQKIDALAKASSGLALHEQQLKNNAEELATIESRIQSLLKEGAIDKSTLETSINARNEAWKEHSEQLDKGSEHAQLQISARQFERHLLSHDHSTAQAIEQGKHSVELDLLQERSKQHQRDAQAISKQINEATLAIASDEVNIKETVPAIFKDTLFNTDIIRERFSRATQLKSQFIAWQSLVNVVHIETEACKQQAQQLLETLSTLETADTVATLAKLDLEDLVIQAEKILETNRANVNATLEHAKEKALYEQELKRRTSRLEQTLQSHNDWHISWTELTEGSIFSSCSADNARDILPTVRKTIEVLAQHAAAKHNVDELNRKIAAWNDAHSTLLTELSSESLDDCNQRLAHASGKQKTLEHLQAQIDKLGTSLNEVNLQSAQDTLLLNNLCNNYKIDQPPQLIELLERTARWREAESLCAEAQQQLGDIAGTVLSEQEITDLLNDYDADVEQNKLQSLNEELTHEDAIYDERHSDWVLADKSLSDIGDDAEYARLTQERSNILLEIEDSARATAIARAGEQILNAAIRKFRQENQSVLLKEAQEAFTTLTAGRYIQLVPRDDGRGNERLYAIDKNNNARAVEALSTGTRYQLYLALRAAAHADYARKRTPLPFVADDIMESFDDDRSAAAFKVLGKMAMDGQVLYLTHHQHLIEIAQQVLGENSVAIHRYA